MLSIISPTIYGRRHIEAVSVPPTARSGRAYARNEALYLISAFHSQPFRLVVSVLHQVHLCERLHNQILLRTSRTMHFPTFSSFILLALLSAMVSGRHIHHTPCHKHLQRSPEAPPSTQGIQRAYLVRQAQTLHSLELRLEALQLSLSNIVTDMHALTEPPVPSHTTSSFDSAGLPTVLATA